MFALADIIKEIEIYLDNNYIYWEKEIDKDWLLKIPKNNSNYNKLISEHKKELFFQLEKYLIFYKKNYNIYLKYKDSPELLLKKITNWFSVDWYWTLDYKKFSWNFTLEFIKWVLILKFNWEELFNYFYWPSNQSEWFFLNKNNLDFSFIALFEDKQNWWYLKTLRHELRHVINIFTNWNINYLDVFLNESSNNILKDKYKYQSTIKEEILAYMSHNTRKESLELILTFPWSSYDVFNLNQWNISYYTNIVNYINYAYEIKEKYPELYIQLLSVYPLHRWKKLL
jgi:hypothetical protein